MKYTVALALLTVLQTGCDGRPRTFDPDSDESSTSAASSETGTILEFDLQGSVPEGTSAGLLMTLPASKTYTGLVRALERARENHDAAGYFVTLGANSLPLERSEELGGMFRKLREAKKPVVCHAHGLDNSSAWFFAQACDRIWLSPAGTVDTVGLATQTVYLKGALDRLHVQADFLHIGRFKTAAENLTRQEPSEAGKENWLTVLRSTRETWLRGADELRPGKKLRSTLEHGPWTAEEALKQGLVDALGHESEARADAKKQAKTKAVASAFGKDRDQPGLDVAQIVRLIAGGDTETNQPHIAVVPAEGSIAMSAGGILSDSGITSKALQKTVRRLAKDKAVKAVVLRIDSPGGSALASDILWNELWQLRKKKPLIASVAGMAASGGYYLACAANKIVAEKTSIVGSIGVVGGKIVLDDALAQVGVNAVTLAASPEPDAAARAAYMSPLSPWNDEIRKRMRAQLDSIYELFLKRVSKGRNMPVDAIRPHAAGRIWSGTQALERKLIDEIGGLSEALAAARKLAKLDAEAPVRVEGTGESLLEMLMLGEDARESEVVAALARVNAERSLVVSKVEPWLRPFIGSLQPLLSGEVVVAATPIAGSIQ